LNNKNEARQAIKRIDKIIQEWEENNIESREMVELMVPDLRIIICYFERIQNKIDEKG
jgi:Zn ribbon nucleic-acid-binding protein